MMNNKKIALLEAENTQLKNKLAEQEILIKYYIEQLRLARLRRFGPSCEQTPLDQLSLFNEVEETASVLAPEPEFEEVAAHRRKKRVGKREEDFSGLYTEQIIHELPEDERICPECGCKMHECGHTVLRREVEVIPAQIKAVEHIQTVYSCRDCEENGEHTPMKKADVPKPVIAGSGVASPSLLSFIFCNKYVLALPLYRQEEEFKRAGFSISRQTMSNWAVYASSKWLQPFCEVLKESLIRHDMLHADETVVQVLHEEGKTPQSESRMWLYCTGCDTDEQIILFEYQPTREGEHARNFLDGFSGYLHTDGYQGYNTVDGVTLVGCCVHMRRKFDEALKALPKDKRAGTSSQTGLDFCNKLFALERKYADLEFQERHRLREKEAKPVAEAFFEWVGTQQFLPKTTFGKAIVYAQNQKDKLMNVFCDGRLELSNNRAENSIRPFAIGRKNWLFSNAVSGAKASAAIYSIVETAKANELVPMFYMKLLFEKLPNVPPEQYTDYLPWGETAKTHCAAANIPRLLG